MERTHWKKLTNPNYLGAYSFNLNEEKILTIKQVSTELVIGTDGKKEQCTVARFFEKEKPMILNRTNCKIITKLYKTPFIEEWQNRKIQVYVSQIRAFGETVDALRIKAIIPQVKSQSKDLTCVDCKKEIKPAYGKTAERIAEHTYKNYGKQICAECAEIEAARKAAACAPNTNDLLENSEESINENN